MQKFFYVLGVSHRVQGEVNFKDSFYDPDYSTVVRDLIRTENIDFVAEEGGDHTTAAEKITDEFLGPGHYLNVSPRTPRRSRYWGDIQRIHAHKCNRRRFSYPALVFIGNREAGEDLG